LLWKFHFVVAPGGEAGPEAVDRVVHIHITRQIQYIALGVMAPL
jgi:hypothetical protein